MYMKVNKRNNFVTTGSQAKTSGAVSTKGHGMDKGVDLNSRHEKHIIKPLSTITHSH